MVFQRPRGRGRIQQLGRSEPDNGDRNRVDAHRLCIQSVIEDVRWSLMAATVGRRHFHLLALILHLAAAGSPLGGQLRAGEQTRHRGRQIRHQ